MKMNNIYPIKIKKTKSTPLLIPPGTMHEIKKLNLPNKHQNIITELSQILTRVKLHHTRLNDVENNIALTIARDNSKPLTWQEMDLIITKTIAQLKTDKQQIVYENAYPPKITESLTAKAQIKNFCALRKGRLMTGQINFLKTLAKTFPTLRLLSEVTEAGCTSRHPTIATFTFKELFGEGEIKITY